MSGTDLIKFLTFKVVKHPNPIESINSFTKPNYNLYM